MSDKIYVGSGKGKFDNDLIEVNICLSDLPKEHIFEYNGKEYIKLKVGKKREVDQYGKSHYVEIDTWKPEQKNDNNPNQSNDSLLDSDDMPF